MEATLHRCFANMPNLACGGNHQAAAFPGKFGKRGRRAQTSPQVVQQLRRGRRGGLVVRISTRVVGCALQRSAIVGAQNPKQSSAIATLMTTCDPVPNQLSASRNARQSRVAALQRLAALAEKARTG